MPQGAQFFDAAGNLVSDTNARLGRVHAFVDIGGGSGSFSVPELVEGSPFYGYITGGIATQPAITISGTTLFWSGGTGSGTILVGTF